MASSEKKNDFGWVELLAHQTPAIQPKIIRIGDSLWYSTSYKRAEQGMVEYNYKTDKVINIAKYPENIKPGAHWCCKHGNKIYIIDGKNNHEIILFDPSKHSFKKLIDIPDLGAAPSCVVINDDIHIIGGKKNDNKYIIYSIKQNTIKMLNDTKKSNVYAMISLKYQDKIIKFGGMDCSIKQPVDKLYSTSIIQENNNVVWSLQKQYELKCGINCCGYILFEHHIIIFGGAQKSGNYQDAIYVLDLRRDIGWIELQHIRCPLRSSYRAVLDGDYNVHLFTQVNQWPEWEDSVVKHFAIGIREIIPDVEMLMNGYMRICVFEEKIIDKDQYDISINAIIVDYIGYVYHCKD